MRHQIHLTTTGSLTEECRVGLPIGNVRYDGLTLKLKHVVCPKVWLIAEITAAVTANGQAYNMPTITSVSQLINWLDSLDTGGRVMHVFYSNFEFEVCTLHAVTLHADLTSLLKLSTTIAANTCVSSHVDPATWPVLQRGYQIRMKTSGLRGMSISANSTDVDDAEIIGQLLPDQDCSRCSQLAFVKEPRCFYVEAYYINSDMSYTIVPLAAAQAFEVVLEIDS